MKQTKEAISVFIDRQEKADKLNESTEDIINKVNKLLSFIEEGGAENGEIITFEEALEILES